MRFDVVKETIDLIVLMLKEFKSIYEIRLFGSQNEKHNNESDIDIAILCYNKNDYNDILKCLVSISERQKTLIHPVIFQESIEEICKNKYKKLNIIDESSIIYSIK